MSSIRVGPAELQPHLDAVLATVAAPDHREDDERDGRQRFYKQTSVRPGG